MHGADTAAPGRSVPSGHCQPLRAAGSAGTAGPACISTKTPDKGQTRELRSERGVLLREASTPASPRARAPPVTQRNTRGRARGGCGPGKASGHGAGGRARHFSAPRGPSGTEKRGSPTAIHQAAVPGRPRAQADQWRARERGQTRSPGRRMDKCRSSSRGFTYPPAKRCTRVSLWLILVACTRAGGRRCRALPPHTYGAAPGRAQHK